VLDCLRTTGYGGPSTVLSSTSPVTSLASLIRPSMARALRAFGGMAEPLKYRSVSRRCSRRPLARSRLGNDEASGSTPGARPQARSEKDLKRTLKRPLECRLVPEADIALAAQPLAPRPCRGPAARASWQQNAAEAAPITKIFFLSMASQPFFRKPYLANAAYYEALGPLRGAKARGKSRQPRLRRPRSPFRVRPCLLCEGRICVLGP
jgi:hypothetical protein